MKNIILIIMIILISILRYSFYEKSNQYIELLEQCANMYPNNFQDMCL